MKGFISTDDLAAILTEIQSRIKDGDAKACEGMITEILSEMRTGKDQIDREYIGKLAMKKRDSRITDINRMLAGMSLEQIENVHKYTSDEYDEPNHEAVALDAILTLSRKAKTENE